ncbi:MAG: hypothetical protein ACYTXT_25060 [Nostoc sp.]
MTNCKVLQSLTSRVQDSPISDGCQLVEVGTNGRFGTEYWVLGKKI